MERTYMFTDAMIHGIQGMSRWDKESRCIKDITIKNSFAIENGVSKMTLHISQITAIDELDQEYQASTFKENKLFTLDNISAQNSFRTGVIKTLKATQYKSLRFYIKSLDSSFLNKAGKKSEIPEMTYMEFDIIGGLQVNKGEFPSLLIHFDFTPMDVPTRAAKKSNIFANSFALRNKMERKLIPAFQ
jgi:hypothetical protein